MSILGPITLPRPLPAPTARSVDFYARKALAEQRDAEIRLREARAETQRRIIARAAAGMSESALIRIYGREDVARALRPMESDDGFGSGSEASRDDLGPKRAERSNRQARHEALIAAKLRRFG